jgi:pimeloyl-ACP methyl ester carboxylesterase
MSSIRHGPITEQHDDWRIIGRRLTQQAAAGTKGLSEQGLEHGKVLIITGTEDVIIKKDEIVQDATAALEGNVEFKFIDAGHDAPIAKSQDVVRAISEFWNL